MNSRMSYVYLDHNIVDKIDGNLSEIIRGFFKKNRFVPIVSIASLVEIERGARKSRVLSNIQSLMAIGARFMLEVNSKIIIKNLTQDEIFRLIESRNENTVETIEIINAVIFYLNSSTSREKFLNDGVKIKKEIRLLLSKFESDGENELKDILLEQLDLIPTDVPENFHFSTDIRSRLSVSPKEINNLTPSNLWEKIEKIINEIGGKFPFNFSDGSVKDRLCEVLIFLNTIGYWCDSVKSKKKTLAFHYDMSHGIYGSLCYGIISEDKRFLKRLSAAYYRLSIPTKIFHLEGNLFNSFD